MAGGGTQSSSNRRFRDPKATFYDWLGVPRHADQKEIKRVFKKLAIQMHPDKLGPFANEEAESEANAIFIQACIRIKYHPCWSRWMYDSRSIVFAMHHAVG